MSPDVEGRLGFGQRHRAPPPSSEDDRYLERRQGPAGVAVGPPGQVVECVVVGDGAFGLEAPAEQRHHVGVGQRVESEQVRAAEERRI